MASQRKNKIKIKIVPRYLFIAMIVICLVLLIVSYRFSDSLGPVKSVAGNVITPMQVGINRIGSFFTSKLDYLKKVDDLIAKNKELTDKLNEVSYENKLLLQGKYELDNFRKLYNLDQTYADYPKVAARVISKDTNNWYSKFKIDKGSDDGIKPGMNVMAGNGLVGIITKTGKNYADVRSIIDDSSNVRGMFLDNSETCTVKGNLKLLDEGHIEVTDIKKGSSIQDGYEVVTSYTSQKYHPGILIGYVSGIKVDPSNMTESGYLTPAVDFSKLDMVLIITREKEELY
ncbi:rod shape-determining protein MreC [Catonella massiliensis]|mgnify:FL=1|jgi:rod shape-determining protein mreC|uniref:Cell shape-determining protein MreC n=1 Tax=Catonella massiliensis TaxID=2799636 RepID=A0ABS1IZN3_9FIRM|nr:rod shape-determining protein MreC [Catonella massiliensis]MBF1005942.1 rod shape-determining protein MreC [Lachnospiraceae bacterium]MBK5897134.1 rod shape-determining protein MreC [Catonella massiliensis]